MRTKVFIESFKGNKVLSVWNVDNDTNEKIGKFPLISFGLRKAKSIVDHIDKIKEFVKEVSNDRNKGIEFNLVKSKADPIPHKCPICFGTGSVMNGFYNGRDQYGGWIGNSLEKETCRSCNGTGIVWYQYTSELSCSSIDQFNCEENAGGDNIVLDDYEK